MLPLKKITNFRMEISYKPKVQVNKDKNVTIAGVVAQPLPYLKQSLTNTIEFMTHVREEGKVVSPQAWIFHKGLSFSRRTDKAKIYKDLYGIFLLRKKSIVAFHESRSDSKSLLARLVLTFRLSL